MAWGKTAHRAVIFVPIFDYCCYVAVCLFVATCLSFLSGLDGASGLEDSDLPGMAGDHSLVMDTSGPILPDFPNRPAGNC